MVLEIGTGNPIPDKTICLLNFLCPFTYSWSGWILALSGNMDPNQPVLHTINSLYPLCCNYIWSYPLPHPG
jgi:hypothetical protein